VAGEPGPLVRELVDRGQARAPRRALGRELAEPPEDVAIPVAARHPATVPDREDHLAPGLAQLLGQLDSRLARSDDQYATRRQVRRPPIRVGMHLRDPRGDRL